MTLRADMIYRTGMTFPMSMITQTDIIMRVHMEMTDYVSLQYVHLLPFSQFLDGLGLH